MLCYYFSGPFKSVLQNTNRCSKGKKTKRKTLTGWVTIIWSVVAMATDPSSQPLESESHEWIEGDRKHTVHTCCRLMQYLCVWETEEGCVFWRCVMVEAELGCPLLFFFFYFQIIEWKMFYSGNCFYSEGGEAIWKKSPSLWKPDIMWDSLTHTSSIFHH